MATKKILFVTLTNIGDVILTLPSLDFLRRRFPGARFTVLCGPRAAELFGSNPAVARCIPFDKHAPLRAKVRLFSGLWKERFDLVVDFRNSLFGILLNPAHRFRVIPGTAGLHFSRAHLELTRALAGGDGGFSRARDPALFSGEDRTRVDALLAESGIAGKKLIAVSPGARSLIKRWPAEKFRQLAGRLTRDFGMPVVLIGDAQDRETAAYIAASAPGAIDLTGKTTLPQLAYLLTRSSLLVTNDSANLHLAGYLDVPAVAIFGPTDENRYGPWSSRSAAVTRGCVCRPCRKARCARLIQECMEIGEEEVMAAVRRVMAG